MPRPPLVIGTWGKIRRVEREKGRWVAYARFRDHDGVTRLIERTGSTAQKAEDSLKQSLTERLTLTEDDITRNSTLKAVAEVWFAEEVAGNRALNTERRYREILNVVVLPGLGGVRMHEINVSRLDRFLKAVVSTRGGATALLCKSVLSGVIGLAARHGAISSNPLRDVATIRKTTPEVRALDMETLRDLRSKMYANELAVLRDVVEPTDFMLGTGVRIGEAFATRWADLLLDSEEPTALVHATVVWVNKRGMLIQENPKTKTSVRRLTLPEWLADVLRRRRDSQPVNELDLVFPSALGTVRAPSAYRRQWRELRETIGYEWVEPRTFRKSIATLAGDAEKASEQLGHSGSDITKKHYIEKTHRGPDLRPVLDAIDPSFTHRKQREMPGTDGQVEAADRTQSA